MSDDPVIEDGPDEHGAERGSGDRATPLAPAAAARGSDVGAGEPGGDAVALAAVAEPTRDNTDPGVAPTAFPPSAIEQPDSRAPLRWAVGVLFSLVMHGSIGALMLRWQEPAGASAPAEPMLIELSPVEATASAPAADSQSSPEQPQDTPDNVAQNVHDQPVEQQTPDKPEPVEPQPPQDPDENPQQQDMTPAAQDTPVIPETRQKSDVELPARKEDERKAAEKKPLPKQPRQHETTTRSETARPTPAASASRATRLANAGAGSPTGGPSPSDWKSQVISILERNKRYPANAQSDHEQGTAHLAFTLNRQGQVTSAHLAGSSGSAALDAETLSLVHRVSFPPPPASMGAPISLVVALRYNIR